MGAILGVFEPGGAPPEPQVLRRMLDAMQRRGSDDDAILVDGSAALAVSRYEWEQAEGFGGPAVVATDGGLSVVADASLYYRDDLLRALDEHGAPPADGTPGHLILAAYRAWGTRCTDRLEGDWAFILWDHAARTVFCASDFGGKRPLFYAEVGGTLVVASTISAILEHPDCPHELDLVGIDADAAGLFASRDRTGYRAIRPVAAGWGLTWQGGRVELERHWSPPAVRPADGLGFEEAAEELSFLLRRAVAERFSGQGPTSVWLSGGWDSTAVFGSGEAVLRDRATGEHLHAVSLSYPPGDPGREDEQIRSVADYWGSPVHWIDMADVPLLAAPGKRAAARDEPFAHAFEMANRALAAGSRAVGARVALDGNGGDQLFQVSNVYLADLLRTGRWISLAREWRRKGLSGSGFRTFFRWALQPNLPKSLLRPAALVRGGRPLRSNLERPVPRWINADFMREQM